MSTELKIHLFGSPKITTNGITLPPFLTHKSCELFVYLAVYPNRSHSRILLAGLLWPEKADEKARASLSTELWRLRRVLGDLQDRLILTRDEVTLSIDSLQIDVHAFKKLSHESDYQSLKHCADLYQQDFMEGFYTDWCIFEREQLKDLFLQVLQKLLFYHQSRAEWAPAISYTKRLLGYDPLREELHRILIKLYISASDRPAALAQYYVCKDWLEKELGIPPMPETQALFEQIQHTTLTESLWGVRVSVAQEMTNQKILELKNSHQYFPEVYTARPVLDNLLNEFIISNVAGFIVVAPSGYGKTNWLAHLAETQIKNGDLVLFYDANSLTLTFERDVARQLWGTEGMMTTAETMLALGREAKKNNKIIWILVDNLNSFRDLGASPADLLRRLNQLLESPGLQEAIQKGNCALKLVISCRDHTWKQMTENKLIHLNWNFYYKNTPIVLDKFTPPELRQAIAKYSKYFSINFPQENIQSTDDFYSHPLLLRLISEVQQGKSISSIDSELSLFREYILKVIPQTSARQLLRELIGWMLLRRKTGAYFSELQQFAHEHGISLYDDISPLKNLLDSGIFIITDQTLDQFIYFSYDRLYEHLLAEHILSQLQKENDNPNILMEYAHQTNEFPLLYRAISIVLSIRQNASYFIALAGSDLTEAHELCVDSLIDLYNVNSQLAISYIKQILAIDTLDAKRVALRAAPAMGEAGYEIFYSALSSTSEAVHRIALISLDQLWRRDFQLAVQLMEYLMEEIKPQTITTIPKKIQTLLRMIGWLSNYTTPQPIFDEIDKLTCTLAVEKLKLPTSETQNILWPFIKNLLARNTTSWPTNESAIDEIVQPYSLNSNEQNAFRHVINTLRQGKSGLENVSVENLKILLHASIDPARYPAHHQLNLWMHFHPNQAAQVIHDLFDDLNAQARLWLLMAFIPLSIKSEISFPYDALNILEELTARFAEENEQEFFHGIPKGALYDFGAISFFPLGLRYLQAGKTDFPLMASMTELSKNATEKQSLILSLLEPLGWSHPQQVLNFLSGSVNFTLPINHHIIKTLGSIRVIHPKTVDIFIAEQKINQQTIQQIKHSADVEKITHRTRLISTQDVRITSIVLSSPYGFWLTDCVMSGYLESKTPKEAAQRFGEGLFEMLRQSDWHLKRLFGIPD